MLLAKKNTFSTKTCTTIALKTIGHLQTFSIKRAIICEFFVANPLNSCVMLDWPVSTVLYNFWSSGL